MSDVPPMAVLRLASPLRKDRTFEAAKAEASVRKLAERET